MSDIEIADIQLADNTSQRLPCVLVLDGSGSMDGDPIRNLNDGLKVLEEELKGDDTAAQRVRLLVLRMGDDDDVETVTDWTDAIDFSAPTIEANGRAPMGAAMLKALDEIEDQKELLKESSTPYNRPWIFLITDGEPTEHDWRDAAAQCREAEDEKKVTIFTIGTAEANFEILTEFSNRQPVKLDGLKFKELFVWLSRSTSSASQAAQSSEVQLEAPDWGTIQT